MGSDVNGHWWCASKAGLPNFPLFKSHSGGRHSSARDIMHWARILRISYTASLALTLTLTLSLECSDSVAVHCFADRLPQNYDLYRNVHKNISKLDVRFSKGLLGTPSNRSTSSGRPGTRHSLQNAVLSYEDSGPWSGSVAFTKIRKKRLPRRQDHVHDAEDGV